jgi:hypothetical protein
MRVFNRLLLLGATVAVLFPCAIDPTPNFSMGPEPEKIDEQFLKGHLGIITLQLEKRYEFAAYRSLQGLPLEPFLNRKPAVVSVGQSVAPKTPREKWESTAAGLLGQAPAPRNYFDGFRVSGLAGNYYYEDCLDSGFDSAVRIAEDRRQKYETMKQLTDWVKAQVQVFANCSGKSHLYPDDLPADSPALERADRKYQIAAAHFYAEDLEASETLFRAIAADGESPWREVASYMVGRTLMRESSLLGKPDALKAAADQFRAVIADPNAGEFHKSAAGLMDRAQVLMDPRPKLRMLAAQLEQPAPEDLEATVNESAYIMGMDSFKNMQGELPEAFDWVRTLEASDGSRALARWKETRSRAWLTLALMYPPTANDEIAGLIEAADQIPRDYPGYDTITFHSIGLKIALKRTDEARTQLDQLLGGGIDLHSVENAWRGQRMELATSFNDFLQWAPRRVVWSDAGQADATDPMLGPDSIAVFNDRMPTGKLEQAAKSTSLPRPVASQVAAGAFARAVLLRDSRAIRELADAVGKSHPTWRTDISAVVNAADAGRDFAIAMLILKHSEIDPELHVGVSEWLGGDWWCAPPPPETRSTSLVLVNPRAVLSAEDEQQAAIEIGKLSKTGATQEFLAPIVMAWAQSHPDDRRVPEALHRLIRVTRYGCKEVAGNGAISKAAFDLLHRRYPRNEWTQKTPYWFN